MLMKHKYAGIRHADNYCFEMQIPEMLLSCAVVLLACAVAWPLCCLVCSLERFIPCFFGVGAALLSFWGPVLTPSVQQRCENV